MSDSAWTVDDCRRRVRELQAANRELADDLQRTAGELVSARYALELSRKRSAVQQRELESSHRREKALLAELIACKTARGAGHTTEAGATPLRPPRGKP